MAHSILALFLMPFTLVLMLLGMMLSLIVMMVLMLFGAYFSNGLHGWKPRHIWEQCPREERPVLVLEVGGTQRGTTWKVGLNGINP